MSTSWALTAREIMRDGLGLIGAVGIGEPIPGDLYLLTLRTFNGIVKELPWQGWAWPNISLGDTSVAWSSGTPSYVTVPGDYLEDLIVSRTDSAGNRIELTPITRAKWLEMPNRSQIGMFPLNFYEDADGKVYLWPVPTQDPQIVVSYVQIPSDISPEVPPDFPAGAALALQWGIAAHMAPHFQIDPTQYASVWVQKREDLIANGVSSAPVSFELIDS